MKRALALTHAEFEGPSRIGSLLAERGYEVEVRSLHLGDEVPASLAADVLLVVMGGPMGVGVVGQPEFAYLAKELELLRERLRADAPVLGVCLGAQLLAHAAGARVYPMNEPGTGNRQYEVGWAALRFHGAADARVLAGMPAEAVVLHWHGDTFELPVGATLLASSERCANQAFRLGRRAFGLQFHCETTPGDHEIFLREDAAFVRLANGEGGVELLRDGAAQHFDQFRNVGDRLLRNILDAMTDG